MFADTVKSPLVRGGGGLALLMGGVPLLRSRR